MIRFFGVTFLMWLASAQASLVEESLKELSLHEKMCMGVFFEHAIKQDQAAHVVCFDHKPACLIGTILKHKTVLFRIFCS